MDIDEDHLVEVWAKQGGKCIYTNIPMIMPNSNTAKQPHTGSLDRIDSSIGYLRGNIQFVCYSINVAKNDFDEETFKSFLAMLLESD